MKSILFIMKICVAVAVLCSLSFASAAVGINTSSAGQISGKITHVLNQSQTESLSVSLYSSADSSLVAGTLTDTTGNFSFCLLGHGGYYLEIGNPGFKPLKIEDVHITSGNVNVNLGEIKYIECRYEKRKKK